MIQTLKGIAAAYFAPRISPALAPRPRRDSGGEPPFRGLHKRKTGGRAAAGKAWMRAVDLIEQASPRPLADAQG